MDIPSRPLLFVCGFLIGIACLIPGISAGTIAWVMGCYSLIIQSLRNCNGYFFKLALQGKWELIRQYLPIKELAILSAGALLAIGLLAQGVHHLLASPYSKICLYAGFSGLALASMFICLKQLSSWKIQHVFLLLGGFFVAWFSTVKVSNQVNISHVEMVNYLDPWLWLCGALAICATLLPGISGAYILSMLGVYPSFIAALATMSASVQTMTWHSSSVLFIANMFVGCLLGVYFFSRVIGWFLSHYSDQMLVVMVGFIMGSLKVIWPIGKETEVHSYTSILAWMIVGSSLLFVLEWWRVRNRPSEESSHGRELPPQLARVRNLKE